MAELKAITHRVTQCDEVSLTWTLAGPLGCVSGGGCLLSQEGGSSGTAALYVVLYVVTLPRQLLDAPFVPLLTRLSCPAMGQNERRPHLSRAWGECNGDLVRSFKSPSASLAPILACRRDRKPGWLGLHNGSALWLEGSESPGEFQQAPGLLPSREEAFRMLSSLLWGSQK